MLAEKKVLVTTRENATQRTRNRLREHGSELWFHKFGTPQTFGGRESVFFSTSRDVRESKWFGWLPIDEIEIEGVEMEHRAVCVTCGEPLTQDDRRWGSDKHNMCRECAIRKLEERWGVDDEK